MKQKKHVPLLYIGPQLLFFLVFLVVPFFYGFYISFTNYNLGNTMDFIGLTNYTRIFNPESFRFEQFWGAIKNTLIFMAITVPLIVAIPLVFAQLLSNFTRNRTLFQSLIYIPSLFSVTSSLLVWIWMFNNESGVINFYLEQWFGVSIPWLTTNPYTWTSMVIATIWWTVGGNLIIFSAGIQEISTELYEAADIDGANKFYQFLYVTIPGLKNQLTYAVVMTILASANVFGQPLLMTGGGPGDSTRSISMLIREVAFEGTVPRAGQASAMSMTFGMIIIVISFAALYFMNRSKRSNHA
ncbi:sugar ABC transporter permease [Vibrio cholerae]